MVYGDVLQVWVWFSSLMVLFWVIDLGPLALFWVYKIAKFGQNQRKSGSINYVTEVGKELVSLKNNECNIYPILMIIRAVT